MTVDPTTAPYAARLERLRARLRHAGLDYCFVGPSSDLQYLTGLDLHSSERLAVLIVPQEAPAQLVVPSFEAAGLGSLPAGLRVAAWAETDDPVQLVAGLLRPPENGTTGTAAVSDQLWAIFLLRLQAALPRVTFCPADETLAPLRLIKDAAEVAALVEAGARADAAFTEICALRFAGRSERAVAEDIAALLRRRGFRISWGPIVGSGPNGASPHHTASDRIIEVGDLVVLDYGGGLDGYNADMTRTVAVGHAPEGEMRAVYDLVQQGQAAGVAAAQPGMSGQDLDSVVRDFLTQAGYGAFFTHRLGHGLGLDTHEPPYLVQGNTQPLQAGMAFSIEPGLYLPGRFGVRIEDIVVLTADGARRMNNAPHDLVVVQ
ncbi:MAG: Xaa-Pro peptidase family protein [Chloroflexota bacterium]|nr:Xaa-Pro peptidase family protein [Chloroflexota bacterium]